MACLWVGWLSWLGASANHAADREAGDAFLDGIGETALVARYRLAGNLADSSRNGYQATLRGTGADFGEDPRFGKVLLLPGTGGASLEIPSATLDDLDSLTVTGWIFLRSGKPDQPFFALGADAQTTFECTLAGGDAAEGYRARITRADRKETQGATGPAVPSQRWMHLAVVLDAARHTLGLYLDGARVAQQSGVTLNLESLRPEDEARSVRFLIGRSLRDSEATLDAKLHDLRIYGVALTDRQIAALPGSARGPGAGETPSSATAADGSSGGVQEPASYPRELLRVPDLSIETITGTLPHLPRLVTAEYQNGVVGPRVRVIWPSPTNNQAVLQAGTYVVTGRVAGTRIQPRAQVTVRPAATTPETPAPRREVEPFPLDRVRLDPDEQGRETPWTRHRDKFIRGLAQTNPDRFLWVFRDAFGREQPPGVEPLGVWDSPTTRLRGHATGHYLSALAQAYAGSGYDPELRAVFLRKLNHVVDTLQDLARSSGRPVKEGDPFNADPTAIPPGPGRTNFSSDLSSTGIRRDFWNWGEGYVGPYPPDQFILLEQGATYGTGNHQIWAPYYTLHKLLAGLLDAHEVGGDPRALEVARGLGHWVRRRLQVLPESTRTAMWSRYIAGEYGGMNEVLARLARLTGDARFVECARWFDNVPFFFGDTNRSHGLARNVDTLRGRHANQHIPQITGALELYRNTGEPAYRDVATHFWRICTEAYAYSIGGVAGARNPNNAECFTAEPDSLFANGFARGGQNETCATYNLLKLTRQLFLDHPQVDYLDYLERSLLNDILASVAANDPGNTYHIPLNPGARKQFGNAGMDGFTCCNGTALESGTKLQDSIYFHSADNRTLHINLFVSSTLVWSERGVTVSQRTRFPYSDTSRLRIAGDGRFALAIRVPGWATKGIQVRINGREEPAQAAAGTFLTLDRDWRDGDTVEWRVPLAFHLDPVMDRPNLASLLYGPVLLAAEETGPRADWRPVTLDAADLGKSITGDPATLRFRIGDATLLPFHEARGRYSAYLNVTWK